MRKPLRKLATILIALTLLVWSNLGWGQALLTEDFDQPAGTNLVSFGWTAHSGAGTSSIQVVTPGLEFAGYSGSGIGGAAGVVNNGEDVHKTFTEVTSGVVYAAFIIKTESTNSAGYFLHFGQGVIGTIYFSRVWVNATGDGVGIGGTAPSSYIPVTAGVPTLLVVKYTIATKLSELFVFNTFPTEEPSTALASFTETGTYTGVGSIALRQYNASQKIIVDGIRVATTWGDAVKSSGPSLVANPDELVDFSYFVDNGPSTVKSFSVSGTSLTSDITIALPTNYELALANDPFVAETSAITLQQTTGTVSATDIFVRLKAGLTEGAYNESISITSTGANPIDFALKGSVLGATTQTIELTGDYSATYYAGDNVTVTWTSANIDNVKVEAWVPSENGGAGGWISMVETVAAAAGTTTFAIPADAQYSANYKIRISDEADGEPSAESGNIKVREVHASLETLRARPANTEARFDGSAIVTYSRPPAGRNQKYIQDDKAAILIDDNSAVITQAYPVGSEISGLVGRVSPFNALVQFVPLADPGAPISLGNDVVPFDATIAGITSADQAKLVKLTNVKFTTFGTGVFVSGSSYDLTDENQATKVFRASFAEVDYIGQSIPTATLNELLVLVGENNGVIQLTSRNMADWHIISTDATLSAFKLGGQSVLELAGLVVADPAADAGATLNVADFTDFAGVEVTPTDANSTIVVKLNGTVVEAANLATQALADGDVVVVTVTAEDGTTVKHHKVTLSSENRVLALTAPVGGANFNTGDDIVFTWTSANIANVNIYAVDSEEVYQINESPIVATVGTYTHTIENGVFGSYIIRIADAADATFFDETATAITITDDDAPNAVTFTPANGATNVALSFTLSAEFDEEIKLGTGNLTIHKASDNSVVVTVAAANITIDDNVASAEITGLTWETAYYVNVQAGLVLDMSNNPVGAITTATNWAFTTMEQVTFDLFFSEYIEGSSNNKALEIFNPTNQTIDLSNYVVKQANNGNGWGNISSGPDTRYVLPLTGTLAPGEVLVLANAQSAQAILDVADFTYAYVSAANGADGNNVLAFNGDDAIGLFKHGVLIDVIGDPNNDPGTNWPVAGTGATSEYTLVRKNSIQKGTDDWAASAGTNADDSQWVVYPSDTFEHLGSHDFASSVRSVWGTSIAAFPNPFTHTLYIDNAENATRVVVINLIGQQVLSVNLNGDSRVPIATENLAKGIYLVSIENSKGERTVRKMIKR